MTKGDFRIKEGFEDLFSKILETIDDKADPGMVLDVLYSVQMNVMLAGKVSPSTFSDNAKTMSHIYQYHYYKKYGNDS